MGFLCRGWVGRCFFAATAITVVVLGGLQREHLPGTDLPGVVFGQDSIFGPDEDVCEEPFEERGDLAVEVEREALVFQSGPEFEGGEAAFVGGIVGCDEVVEAICVEGAGG